MRRWPPSPPDWRPPSGTAWSSAGLSPSNYLGNDGLWERDDLAGLNLSTRPTVMVESGNMRSSADAALMSSEQGQQQFAQGYANGVLNFLGGGAG